MLTCRDGQEGPRNRKAAAGEIGSERRKRDSERDDKGGLMGDDG